MARRDPLKPGDAVVVYGDIPGTVVAIDAEKHAKSPYHVRTARVPFIKAYWKRFPVRLRKVKVKK